MEMGDQYGLQDLRQLMARRTHFPAIPQATATATATEPLFSVHRNLTPPQHYETIMMGRHTGEVILPRGLVDNINNTTATATTSAGHVVCGLEMEGCGITGGEGGNSRWPRQETLTLLEIRSCLDSKFKEANQKGPLWDEVSRIMAEEHGYQRSGKKCREKFENLYKYYKKTKEGKAGRQDGKHYRFFRQLEALYGDTSTNNINAAASASLSETNFVGINTTSTTTLPYQEALQDQNKLCCESLSFTNYSSEFEASSSENNDNNHDQDLSAIAFMMNHSTEMGKNMNETHGFKRARKSWKAKIKDFIDSHMRKLMETQEAWMDKMLKTIEHKEQERLSREEEWRKQEAARFDREYKFWANERALVEARDVALLEALKKLAGKELKVSSLQELIMDKTIHHQDHNIKNMEDEDSNRWHEPEISSLIELRNSMEPRFQESGCLKEGLWDEIAVKMACLGYDRSAISCKENWENAVIYFNKASMECNKKRKENLRSSNTYFQQPEYSYDHHDQDNIGGRGLKTVGFIQPMINDDLSSSNSNVGTAMHESCFRILGDEGENLGWENYGVKLSKGRN